jgi:hypothetical protein
MIIGCAGMNTEFLRPGGSGWRRKLAEKSDEQTPNPSIKSNREPAQATKLQAKYMSGGYMDPDGTTPEQFVVGDYVGRLKAQF